MTNTSVLVEVELPLSFPHCEVRTIERCITLSEVKERHEPDLPFHLPVLTRDMLERRTQARRENDARMMQHCHSRIDRALDENKHGRQ